MTHSAAALTFAARPADAQWIVVSSDSDPSMFVYVDGGIVPRKGGGGLWRHAAGIRNGGPTRIRTWDKPVMSRRL